MELVATTTPTRIESSSRKPPQSTTADRVRVDGKFFACGPLRLRLQGVTYGPFAPNADGDAFPVPEQVRDDLDRMRHVGVNALRTYHVPPVWFLRLADEAGVHVLIDVPQRSSQV